MQCRQITQSSNIWNNSDYKNSIGCKKEEINKNYDVKHVIMSECCVVLKRLNIKVKTKDCEEEEVYLPDEYEYLKLIEKNKFFTPKKKFKRNEMKIQMKEEEQSKKNDIQHNPKRAKHYEYKMDRKRFGFPFKKFNKIQWNIKTKYLKIIRASHSKENFICNLCTQTFRNSIILRAHLLFHIGNKPFHCTTCNQKFLWKFLLHGHVNEHNSENQIKTNSRKVYQQSTSKNLEESNVTWKIYQRDIRDKHATSKYCSERHKVRHTAYFCKVCKKEFKWKDLLRQHELWHTEDRPFKCDVCSKSFKRKDCLRNHNDIHTGEYKYSCLTCNKSFKTENSLRNHKVVHSDKNKYFCETCNVSFKHRSTFVKHRLVQHENMFVCVYCYKPFKTENMLKAHSKTHIQKCNICKKELSNKYKLIHHQRIHFDIKPFHCEMCNRTFKFKHQLKSHEASHNGGNSRYVCEVCKKGFYFKNKFLTHQRIHLSKRHACSHCKNSFETENKLKYHLQYFCLKLYHKQLPYQCDICKQTFTRRFEFEKHLITYNDQMHFCCDICKKIFTMKLELQTHQETSHATG